MNLSHIDTVYSGFERAWQTHLCFRSTRTERRDGISQDRLFLFHILQSGHRIHKTRHVNFSTPTLHPDLSSNLCVF